MKVVCQLENEDSIPIGSLVTLPVSTTPAQLSLLLLSLGITTPHSFTINSLPLNSTLSQTLTTLSLSTEQTIKITILPQTIFKVKSITRSSASLVGHGGSILVVKCNSQGTACISGSGDHTIRIWDLQTELPITTSTSTKKIVSNSICKAHTHWVCALEWSQCGSFFVSGGMDGLVCIWTAKGIKVGECRGHKGAVTGISWCPLHLLSPQDATTCTRYFITCSKDATCRIWNATTRECIQVLSGHTAAVMCIKWLGNGLLISGGRDRILKLWHVIEPTINTESNMETYKGQLFKLSQNVQGHAHWINSIACSSDFIIRIGGFDPWGGVYGSEKGNEKRIKLNESNDNVNNDGTTMEGGTEKKATNNSSANRSFSMQDLVQGARKQYTDFLERVGKQGEVIASCSDDFTLILWKFCHKNNNVELELVKRMTGHLQLVNHISFSPDGRYLTSASFDKSIKLWNGRDGSYRQH
jgi:ribosome assembly protein 4